MAFLKLSRPALINLATALETGRLCPPFFLSHVTNYVPAALSGEVADELNRLTDKGLHPEHLAYTLHLLAAERITSQEIRDRVDIVWTGEEVVGSQSRSTSVVVRELFSTAKKSVLISSFALDKGEKARRLFQLLAQRMDTNSKLQVRMFLNVQRPHNSEVADTILLREFTNTFRRDIWQGQRLPEVFYYPRSLAFGTESKACLHAKCVVVDDERVLVTSANFTEAAHERNIEAGVLLTDPVAARTMRSQFETLVFNNTLRRLPGI